MGFFKSLFTNKKRLAILIIVVLVAGYFGYLHYGTTQAQTSYVLGTASNQTIVSSVTGTGQVSQDHTVNVSPGSSGKLTSVNVVQGQAVKAGQTIAIVDETNNQIALNQAEAGLASSQANYNSVLAGDTTQDIQLAQLTVQSDQQAITEASTSLASTEKQDSTNVANALSTLLNSTPQAVASAANLGTGAITITGNYTATAQGTYTVSVYSTNAGQQWTSSGLETSSGPVRTSPAVALGMGGLFLSFTGHPSNGDTWTITLPNTLAPDYLSNYNAYQNTLTAQQNDITSAQNQITSDQNKLQQDQINLQVKQEPPTDATLQSAKASLTSAQASVQNAQINYNNNILTAPFDGTVAELNNQIGDEVSNSTVVATITNNQTIATIPLNEIDVAQVKVGDKATLTFNAIPNLTITGTVVEIDNIGTVSQGVVSYNVKIAFDTENPQVKAGMTVSAAIISSIAADVLSVPNSAIQTQGTASYVLVLSPAQTTPATGQSGVIAKTAPTRVLVQTGASDSNNTQITSGNITAGDSVVTQTISSSNAKSAAATATSALRLGGGAFGGGAGGFGGATGGATRVTTGGARGG